MTSHEHITIRQIAAEATARHEFGQYSTYDEYLNKAAS